MAEGNWTCGMCAAHNESSKHACMVCHTLRVLGVRGNNPAPGDLLASTQSMFGEPEKRLVTAPHIKGTDDPARVRVTESPPVLGEVRMVPTARAEGHVTDAGGSRYEIVGGTVVSTGAARTEIGRPPLDSAPATEGSDAFGGGRRGG